MGIQSLFKNLLDHQKLIEIDDDIKNYTIFIDFSCIFYTYLHVCESENEANEKIKIYINKLSIDNKIKLFIDDGNILIKKKERDERKIQTDNCIKNITNKLNKINLELNSLNAEDNDCTRYLNTVNHHQKKILEYKLNIYNSDYRKNILKKLLLSLDKYEIYKKKKVDAEFYMSRKIIRYKKKYSDKKILIITNDQDIFLFILNNYIDTHIHIRYIKKTYKLIIDNISKNISILTLMFNKSDYFGIKNYLYDTKKIDISMLDIYPKYSFEYIFNMCNDLLKYKSIKKKNEYIDLEYVKLYINQLIMYIKIDYNIYKQNIISNISINNILYILNS